MCKNQRLQREASHHASVCCGTRPVSMWANVGAERLSRILFRLAAYPHTPDFSIEGGTVMRRVRACFSCFYISFQLVVLSLRSWTAGSRCCPAPQLALPFRAAEDPRL